MNAHSLALSSCRNSAAIGFLLVINTTLPALAQSPPVVEPMSREKGATNSEVTRLADASDMVVLRITIGPGGSAPWHTHSGIGLLVNVGPGTLTNIIGDDCIERNHFPGGAFVDPGHGEVHAARNLSNEDVVLIATFLRVDGMPVIPATGPHLCTFLD